jgi:hypothetical protein
LATFLSGLLNHPWQLDGVISTLLEDGYCKEKIFGCHNRTVVVSAKRGEVANKHVQVVVDKYGLRNIHLYEEGEEWIAYSPKAKMLAQTRFIPKASAFLSGSWEPTSSICLR